MTTHSSPQAPLALDAIIDYCTRMAALPGASQALRCPPEGFYEKLHRYLTILMQWNARMNLVGATNWQQALENLLADSWHLADFLTTLPMPKNPQSWDLGAGAGLPGIPLRMVWTEGEYTLVEAREKRALFLQSVLAVCPLPGTKVFRGRAEKFMSHAQPATMVISRAFLPWQEVLSLVEPFMTQNGLAVFLTLNPPHGDLPLEWYCLQNTSYISGEDTRFFWALQKTSR